MADEAIRNQYQQHGVRGYYQQYGATYRNPHEPHVQAATCDALVRWPLATSAVLDLACGSGEVTLALHAVGVTDVTGVDPYTGVAYYERTGQVALPHTFEQIGDGALAEDHYSLIVCSFALHLVELSRLPVVAYQLARIAKHLLVLTPHKRPELRAAWGWDLIGEVANEHVRSRCYRSLLT
jgi:SAM-dependent methyltransferase